MKRPLAVLILAYILGIVLGSYLKLPVFHLFWTISGTFLFTLFFFLKKKSLLTNVFLLLSFFLLGICFFLSRSNISPDISGQEEVLIATVVKEPQIREKRILLTVRSEEREGLTQVIVYDANTSYAYGDRIRIKGRLEKPSGLRNPGGFNYQAYLVRRGIYALMKIKDKEDIEIIGIGKVNPLIKFALKVKEKMIRIIRQTLDDPQAAVLEGIMFGKRSALPKEIREDFSNVGVGQVLPVYSRRKSYL